MLVWPNGHRNKVTRLETGHRGGCPPWPLDFRCVASSGAHGEAPRRSSAPCLPMHLETYVAAAFPASIPRPFLPPRCLVSDLVAVADGISYRHFSEQLMLLWHYWWASLFWVRGREMLYGSKVTSSGTWRRCYAWDQMIGMPEKIKMVRCLVKRHASYFVV